MTSDMGLHLFTQADWSCQVSQAKRGCREVCLGLFAYHHTPCGSFRDSGEGEQMQCGDHGLPREGKKIGGIPGRNSQPALPEGLSVTGRAAEQNPKGTSSKGQQQHTETGGARVRRHFPPLTAATHPAGQAPLWILSTKGARLQRGQERQRRRP